MPSTAYSAELRPDRPLRRFVLWSGAVLGGLGLIAVFSLPLPVAWRAVTATAWTAAFALELARMHRAWQDCFAVRLRADGSASALGRDGRWQPVTLLADGVLLRRWGWIRFRTAPGRVFAEPVRGACRDSHDWRRLQVIWRHVGAEG